MKGKKQAKFLEAIMKIIYSEHGRLVINDTLKLSDVTNIKNTVTLENLFELYLMFSLLGMVSTNTEVTNG